MKINPPPRTAEALLEKVLPAHLKEPLLGDLEEEFRQIQTSKTPLSCCLWYWRQTLITTFYCINQTQKALIMFAISVLFFVALTLFAMILGGGVDMFYDLPSFILILPPSILFTFAVTSMTNVKQAFAVLLSGHAESLRQVKSCVRVFDVLGNTSMWLGGLMTLLGWVAMGSNIRQVDVIGPAFAVSILTLIYAMVIKIVCYVAAQRVVHLGDSLASVDSE